MLRKSKPAYVNGQYHGLTKGYDIKLNGKPESGIKASNVTRYSVQPPNYRGIAPIPKMMVDEGEQVVAGQALFYDKSNPDTYYVSPVSGTIKEIRRGAKRSIIHVIIDADKENTYKSFDIPNLSKNNKEGVLSFMQSSGLWPLINKRPFDMIADPSVVPKNIFISSFSTAPLAADTDIVVKTNEDAFQKGLDVLSLLTEGKVFLGLDANGKKAPSTAYSNAKNVEKHWFSGPHPAGNVGIQIHHIAPINMGDTVWTLDVQSVIVIGRMFLDGQYNTEKLIAITGAELEHPTYVRAYAGASVKQLLSNNLKQGDNRVIVGDVLSGIKAEGDSYMYHTANQITVIQEGRYFELFGWMMPGKKRPTISRTFFSKMLGLGKNKTFDADSNMHGERRSFVMTGEYESVLPMDMYPVHLFKSIVANDIEMMEGLGIHELSEEDIALCEFVCTSKQPLQKILRDGLDYALEQS